MLSTMKSRQVLKRQIMPSKALRRYVVIGGSVYVFEIVVIVIAQRLGLGSVLSIGLSFWLGLSASFLLHKFVTFGDKRLHHSVLLPQLLAFAGLVMFNFGFTLVVARLLQNKLPAVIARTIALGITTIWNFYLYKIRIFKGSDDIVY